MDKANFDELIKDSLDTNLDKISFADEDKTGVLKHLQSGSFLKKIKKMLNYEIEIPVSYAAICTLVLLLLLGYDINSSLPGPDEAMSYKLEWVEINYRGMLK